jgi:protein SCO1/2
MTAIAILLSFLAGWIAPVLAHDQERTPATGDPIAGKAGIEQRLNAQIPLDLPLRDEQGEPVSLKRYFDGKPVLLALVYYNCDRVCPLVLEGLARSLRPLDFQAGADYRVIAVSIDPTEGAKLASEKKARLTKLHSRPGAERGWHLLTADSQSIDALARATGFRYTARESKNAAERFIHAPATVVITPEGKIARYFYGFDYPPRELRLSLVEASANRIGTPLDQLLLLCYAYDPSQGRYTLSILNVLRVSSAATLLVLGGFLAVALRRERRGRGGADGGPRMQRS